MTPQPSEQPTCDCGEGSGPHYHAGHDIASKAGRDMFDAWTRSEGDWDAWTLASYIRAVEAAAPDPVASRQRWDYDEPHPFESKDMGNPTYDFCICERPRTDVMHPSDPVARPADAAPRTWREVAAKYRRFLELAADYPDAELDAIEAGAVASPAPLDAPIRDSLIAVGKAEQWDQVPSGTLRILKEAIEARLGQPVAEEPR